MIHVLSNDSRVLSYRFSLCLGDGITSSVSSFLPLVVFAQVFIINSIYDTFFVSATLVFITVPR